MDETLLERYADLIVGFAANVQHDQIVSVTASLGQEELVRAIAAAAYGRGARFVDANYFDPWVKRARIAQARDETLDYVPSWYRERVLSLGRERCSRIGLSGPTAPGLLDDLDPARAGCDSLPFISEVLGVIADRTTNWTVVPCPTLVWAKLVFPELDGEAALAQLWEQIAHVCRLDTPDPAAAWRERIEELEVVGERLSGRGFDAVRFEGPGTDLTVGLLPTSRWVTAMDETVDGIRHLSNLPTEEVYTTPDRERTEGHVRSTRPLVLGDETIIRGLEVRFEGGRAVGIEAEQGAGVLRSRAASDEGAPRLGEVALVDRAGRVGPLGTVFFDTLLDENAASHVALGDGYKDGLAEVDLRRANRSEIHIDFMIGGDDVAVTGTTREGEEVPILRGGTWQI